VAGGGCAGFCGRIFELKAWSTPRARRSAAEGVLRESVRTRTRCMEQHGRGRLLLDAAASHSPCARADDVRPRACAEAAAESLRSQRRPEHDAARESVRATRERARATTIMSIMIDMASEQGQATPLVAGCERAAHDQYMRRESETRAPLVDHRLRQAHLRSAVRAMHALRTAIPIRAELQSRGRARMKVRKDSGPRRAWRVVGRAERCSEATAAHAPAAG
jgi:hypothetical protein